MDFQEPKHTEDEVVLNLYEATPTAITSSAFSAGSVFVQVAAGGSTSFALTDYGLVYGWGLFMVNLIAIVCIPAKTFKDRKGNFEFIFTRRVINHPKGNLSRSLERGTQDKLLLVVTMLSR